MLKMIRLLQISKAFAVFVCLFSLLGIYMVRTVCIAEDIMLTDSHLVAKAHQESHHNPHSQNADDCCSDVTGNYFSIFQATIPNDSIQTSTTSSVPLVAILQNIQFYNNNSPQSPATTFEGPPLPYYSGASKRIMIQSFQI